MSASDHKVGSPITVWQSLGNTFINQSSALKEYWDEVGEIVRVKHDDLCDHIDGIVTDLADATDGSSGADLIGSTAIKVGGSETVQGQLEGLQADKVGMAGNETVAGVKTFSSSPVVPTPTTNMQASTKKYVDDNNALDVHLTGNQTVAGVKTFSSSPIAPTPTTGDTSQKVATTEFVGNTLTAIGAGDMTKGVYDTENKATDIFNYVDARLPAGVVLMWSGSQASIPSGWLLCDGTNGTPNLLGKFIVGAGGAYSVAGVGGEATHVLTSNEMPEHTHTASSNSAGAHTHSIDASGYTNGGGVTATGGVNNASPSTNSSGAHSHTITVNNAGGGVAHENRPPYYALCYIMKS